ncbi:hypothetical protein [Bordetella genomosp. 9]|uniref:DUF1488 domain-containing protein n=1 Tax=Bordetella genomosp. 9 TaxID=1416803 RepID=A0A1W6Z0L2_9BORD|nr:hypothetical protein [Bordetella genomosp. 9]ARP86734.1 hypothetical protein CAL13_11345 [Bordetella genomosp. 9]ARP90722.1 hypothetical protein CAL14_10810 [Bordetella genomosp. 9]
MSFDSDAQVENGNVRFVMHFPDATRTVRVSGETLAEYFGSDGSPAGMIAAYRANFRAIHSVAQIVGARGQGDIMLSPEDVRAAGHIATASSPSSDRK